MGESEILWGGGGGGGAGGGGAGGGGWGVTRQWEPEEE